MRTRGKRAIAAPPKLKSVDTSNHQTQPVVSSVECIINYSALGSVVVGGFVRVNQRKLHNLRCARSEEQRREKDTNSSKPRHFARLPNSMNIAVGWRRNSRSSTTNEHAGVVARIQGRGYFSRTAYHPCVTAPAWRWKLYDFVDMYGKYITARWTRSTAGAPFAPSCLVEPRGLSVSRARRRSLFGPAM